MPATVAIVVGPRRALLGRRAAAPYRGTWDVAGGFLESEKRSERGLRRELCEELGARVRSAVHGIRDRPLRPGQGRGARPRAEVRLVGRIRAGSDVSEVRWFPRNAIRWRRIGFASIRRALRAYLRSR